MKISEMTTDRAAEVLIAITEPISRIVDDPEMTAVIKRIGDAGRDNALSGYSHIFSELVPFCLKAHKEDFFTIVGALDGKSAEKVGKLKLMDTLNIVKESADKDLLDFFKPFVSRIAKRADE